MQSKPAETRRQTRACRSGFLDWRWSQRTDDWRTNLHPFRIGEFFEDGFKARIRFTNAVGILNNRCAICQGACYCQYRQFVNELRHFFALNDGTFERDSCDLDDTARLKLIDIFDGFSHLRAHSQQNAE